MNKELLTQANDEITSGEDEKLRRMLGNLKKIDAPKNFDFALKARISETQAKPRANYGFFPILRYAAPFCLLLILGGFVVFSLLFSTEQAEIPPVAERNDSPVIQIPTLNPSVIEQDAPAANLRNEEAAVALNSNKKIIAVNANSSALRKTNEDQISDTPKFESDGDREEALKKPKVFFPKGLDPNDKVKTPENVVHSTPLSINQILSQFGIEADFVNSKWQIKSIKTNSLSDRSGIKAGDVIEAIDEKNLESETVFAQPFSGRIIHLTRSGRKIAVELRTQ